jgi:4-oxalocrotonate tautomerase
MPLIEVNIWKGMDEKKKEKLISRLTDVICEVIGCPMQAVHIILREVPKENWADSGVQHSVKFKDK